MMRQRKDDSKGVLWVGFDGRLTVEVPNIDGNHRSVFWPSEPTRITRCGAAVNTPEAREVAQKLAAQWRLGLIGDPHG